MSKVNIIQVRSFNSVVFSLLLTFFISARLIGQSNQVMGGFNPNAPYHTFEYTNEDGLSHTIINSIAKDHQGFLWVGTQDGLNRYDGERFRVYKHEPSDSTSVPGNFIDQLYVDSKGRIWISTVDHGIAYYDHQRNTFNKIKEIRDFVDHMHGKIIEDAHGNIWFSLGDHLLKIMFSKNNYTSSIINSGVEPFQCLAIDVDSSLVVTVLGGGIFKVLDNTLLPLTPDQSIDGFIVSLLATNKYYWVNTFEKIYKINRSTGEKKEVVLKQQTSQYFNMVFDDDDLWLCSGTGLYIVKEARSKDWNTCEKIRIHKDRQAGTSISNNWAISMYVDDNYAWIGTSNSLYCMDKKAPVFYNKAPSNSPSAGLQGEVASAIVKSQHGLWVSTRSGGLNLFTENKVYHYQGGDNSHQLESSGQRTLAIDSNQYLWIGSSTGISVLDLNSFFPANPYFIKFKVDENLRLMNNSRHIFIDRQGQVWVTTYGGGVYLFTGDIKTSDFSFRNFKHDPLDANSLSADQVHCIYQDHASDYWIGTRNGLNKMTFNAKNNNPTFTRYYHEDDQPSLIDNPVYDLFINEDNSLWIGTQTGLSFFDPFNQIWKSYNTSNGLPDNVINSIIRDDQDRLWFSSNNGIYWLDEQREKFHHYTKKDGLGTNVFEIFCKYIDEEGRLYFGGSDGFVCFDPNRLAEVEQENEIIITTIKTQGGLDVSESAFTPTNDIESIDLTISQFPLNVGFTALDLRPIKNNQYYYQFADEAGIWNALGNKAEIHITKLAEGNHQLRIRGGSRGRYWNSKPKSLLIKVLPPWWRTTFAYFIYGLILASILYGIYNNQIKRKIADNEALRLRELDEVKSKFYTNITHEFRTPLTVILGLADQLKQKSNDTESERHLDAIQRNGQNLLTLINQLLDLAKVEIAHIKMSWKKIDIVPLVAQVTDGFQAIAHSESISLTFYSEANNCIMDVDEEKLVQVMNNLIGNALKFSRQGDNVVVHLQKTDKSNLQIKVKDSGPGIPMDKIDNIFNRFYQADHSLTRRGEGTGIGLAITKEFVELMDGKLSVESKPDLGTVFTVLLPIRRSAEWASNQSHTLDKNELKTIPTKYPTTPNDEEKLTILVVEDNHDVAQYIKLCLQNDFNVAHEVNGQLGIDHALNHTPDIILSDVMMPEKDGFELCNTLKSDTRTDHIPIILLTAKAEQQDKIQGLQTGADAYLTKPFDQHELSIRINNLVELRKKLKTKYASSIQQLSTLTPSKNKEIKVDGKQEKFLATTISLIQEHLNDVDFNGSILARKIGLSDSQLYRKLKALTDKSTAVYIRSIRLNQAKSMLMSGGEMNVSEVAYACGFSDPNWFSKAFKEEFGVSPIHYLKQHN